jgi:hypothetical protein
MECVKCGEEEIEEAFCQSCMDDERADGHSEGMEEGEETGRDAGEEAERVRWEGLIDGEARRANIPTYYAQSAERQLTAMADRILELERMSQPDD